MSKFVQHKSGQGEKWEVESEIRASYFVKPKGYVLPKSEYIEVPAPEVWIDVTSACSIEFNGEIWHDHKNAFFYASNKDKWEPDRIYRLRKIQVNNPDREPDRWAFIVERRQS